MEWLDKWFLQTNFNSKWQMLLCRDKTLLVFKIEKQNWMEYKKKMRQNDFELTSRSVWIETKWFIKRCVYLYAKKNDSIKMNWILLHVCLRCSLVRRLLLSIITKMKKKTFSAHTQTINAYTENVNKNEAKITWIIEEWYKMNEILFVYACIRQF